MKMTDENKPAREEKSVGEYTDHEIILWGRDALLRIPPINSVGDELRLLVILNPAGDLNSVCERKNSVGDDLQL